MLGLFCIGVLMLISTAAALTSIVCVRTSEEEHITDCRHGEVLNIKSVIFGYEYMYCSDIYEKFQEWGCCNVSGDDCKVNATKDDITAVNNIFVNTDKDSDNEQLNNNKDYHRVSVYFLTPPNNSTCQTKSGYIYSYQLLQYECVKSSAFSTSSRHYTPQITSTTTSTATTTLLTTSSPEYLQNTTNDNQLSSKSSPIDPNIETQTTFFGKQSPKSKDKSGVIGGTVGGLIVVVIIVVVVVLIIKRKRQTLSKPKGKVKNISPVSNDIRIQGLSETNRHTSETSYYEIADFHDYTAAGWVDETSPPGHQGHQPTNTVPSIDIYDHLGEDKSKNKITPNTGLYNHIGETVEGTDIYNHIGEESSRKIHESKTKISQDSGLYHHISGAVEGCDLYNHIGGESNRKTHESKTKISQDSDLYHHISGAVEGADLYNHIDEEHIANSREDLDLNDYDHIGARTDNSHDYN